MRKNFTHSILPMLFFAVGLLLMVFKIYEDSEPGALPLLIIIVSIIWYGIVRGKLHSPKRQE